MRGAKRFLLIAGVAVCSSAFSQNLIANASFEMNSGGTGQGLLPTGWTSLNSSPDTYTNNGSFGLAPTGFGNFTGVTAQDGIAWVAGSSGPPESFGQVLATSLIAGQEYTISGWLHQAVRSDLNNPGGYQVRLITSTSNVLLGTLGDTTSPTAGWVQKSFSFFAPTTTGAQTLAFVPYAAASGTAYPGLDNLQLEAVPEPATMLLAAAGLGLLTRRARKASH